MRVHWRSLKKPQVSAEPINAFQDAVAEMYTTRHLFAVVSWGASGTKWLATLLNNVPGMFALHHGRAALSIFGNCPDSYEMDIFAYARVLSMLGSGNTAAGDVHGISRDEVRQLRTRNFKNFHAVVLTRAPRARLASQLSLFRKLRHLKKYDVQYIPALVDELNLPVPDLSYETLLDVHGINMLNSIIEEAELGQVFRLEDLSTSSLALSTLLHTISGGAICELPDVRIDSTESILNAHHHGQESVFESWHRDVFEAVVSPVALKIYAHLGYRRNECLITPNNN